MMSDNGVFLSVSEYDRLRALDARVSALQAELCAVKSELAEAHAHARPLTARITPINPAHEYERAVFLEGPIRRGVVCKNCECDLWLKDAHDVPCCAVCGLYVDSGVKLVSVTR